MSPKRRKKIVIESVQEAGLRFVGWREVPVDYAILVRKAALGLRPQREPAQQGLDLADTAKKVASVEFSGRALRSGPHGFPPAGLCRRRKSLDARRCQPEVGPISREPIA